MDMMKVWLLVKRNIKINFEQIHFLKADFDKKKQKCQNLKHFTYTKLKNANF